MDEYLVMLYGKTVYGERWIITPSFDYAKLWAERRKQEEKCAYDIISREGLESALEAYED